MRSLVIHLVLAALAAGGFVVLTQASAMAGTVCQERNRSTGHCEIWAVAPGTPGTPAGDPSPAPTDTGSGDPCYWDPSKQGLSGPPAHAVSCHSIFGSWSNTYNCYLMVEKPQPPAGDPSWKGHRPGDGAVYSCYQPETDLLVDIWAANTPRTARTGPTPRQVAQVAVKQLDLSAIDIGIAPEPGPDSIGLVGMPVWMWAKAPDAHTYGPATASASAGGITVTATARVEQITWDMGDGTQVVCRTAGTPYRPSDGRRSSPDCGHTYVTSSSHQPGGAYTVTATSEWVVTWSGAGQRGTILLPGLRRSTQIRIGEAQVLVD